MEKKPLPDLPLDTWPEIRRLKVSGRMWQGFFENFAKAVRDNLGDEGAIAVAKQFAMNAVTPEHVEAGMKHFGITDRGIDAMVKWEVIGCHRLQEAVIAAKRVVEVWEESPTRTSIRFYPPCPLFPPPSPDKVTWIPKGFCRDGMCWYDKNVAKAINPDLVVTPGLMLEDGDPYCELIIELKK